MKLCDHQSVGVIIDDRFGRTLLLTRAKPPKGRAPIAGHVDEHGLPREAAHAEAFEEAGLEGLALLQVAEGHLPNVCRRPPSHSRHDGHYWTIFKGNVGDRTDTKFSDDETHGGGWYTMDELQQLADQTIVAIGAGTDDIGLEPVWLHWLHELGYIRVAETHMTMVWVYFSQPPA